MGCGSWLIEGFEGKLGDDGGGGFELEEGGVIWYSNMRWVWSCDGNFV